MPNAMTLLDPSASSNPSQQPVEKQGSIQEFIDQVWFPKRDPDASDDAEDFWFAARKPSHRDFFEQMCRKYGPTLNAILAEETHGVEETVSRKEPVDECVLKSIFIDQMVRNVEAISFEREINANWDGEPIRDRLDPLAFRLVVDVTERAIFFLGIPDGSIRGEEKHVFFFRAATLRTGNDRAESAKNRSCIIPTPDLRDSSWSGLYRNFTFWQWCFFTLIARHQRTKDGLQTSVQLLLVLLDTRLTELLRTSEEEAVAAFAQTFLQNFVGRKSVSDATVEAYLAVLEDVTTKAPCGAVSRKESPSLKNDDSKARSEENDDEMTPEGSEEDEDPDDAAPTTDIAKESLATQLSRIEAQLEQLFAKLPEAIQEILNNDAALRNYRRFLEKTIETARELECEAYVKVALSSDGDPPVEVVSRRIDEKMESIDYSRLPGTKYLDAICRNYPGGVPEFVYRFPLSPGDRQSLKSHPCVVAMRNSIRDAPNHRRPGFDLFENKDCGYLISLSGGVDSIVHTCVLSILQDEFAGKVAALHLRHSNRSEQIHEEKWIAFLCQKLGIQLYLTRHSNLAKSCCWLRQLFWSGISW